MLDGPTRAVVVGLALLVLEVPLCGLAGGEERNAEEVSLPSTLVTEGALPATEVEGTFTYFKSQTEREYGFGFSSLQYAPVSSFGIKLAVPAAVRDPRDTEPSEGGIGDVSLMAKYALLLLPAQQFALAGGLKVTFPTGDAGRGLGGTFAIAPLVMAGKGFGPFSLQADAAYSWQLNRPARIEEEGEEAVRPDKQQEVTANLTATFAPVDRLGLILELNSVTRTEGEDDPLKGRVQLYLTPGASFEPATGWNLRAGVQLPLTSAREFDYNVIVILTKGF